MPENEAIVVKEPGGRINVQAYEDITGKRFVSITANSPEGPICVVHSGLGQAVLGVASYDAADHGYLQVISDPGIIVTVEAGDDVALNEEVMSDANGCVIPFVNENDNVCVGRVVLAAQASQDAQVKFS